MKKYILAALVVSATSAAIAQISIPLGQSGYYGRIDLGNLGAPPVIYRDPMLVERRHDYRPVAPIYLRVPDEHARRWSRYCAAYDACNRPVYFVQDSWYNNTYAPHYRRSDAYRDHSDADKDRAKDRHKAWKEREKDRREFEKDREKDRREAEKEYYKDLKEADKERRKAEKEYYKDLKDRYKD